MATKYSHLKSLSKEKLNYLNNSYIVKVLNEDSLLMISTNINRQVLHTLDKKIVINLTKQGLGSAIIFPETLNYYVKEKLSDTKWSIFEIQNAINVLKMSHEEINVQNILDQLVILDNYYKKEVIENEEN